MVVERIVKKRLIEDYERYVMMFNSDNNLDSWNIKYMSIIVYISDLFADLYDEDIEDNSLLRVDMGD